MTSKKVELFREGLFYSEVDENTFALEWDFSDSYLEELGPRVCPVCGGRLEVDDGVLHCSSCDWVYE